MEWPYVITEGEIDTVILKAVLPERLVKGARFVPGSSQYFAHSLASSILAVRNVPVALVVDAKTTHRALVREQQNALRAILDHGSPGVRFEVFLAVPEIEVLLFCHRPFIERAAGRPLTDAEWQLAELHPRELLAGDLRISLPLPGVGDLLGDLDPKTLEVIRLHPLVQGLVTFLSSLAMVDWFQERPEGAAQEVAPRVRDGSGRYTTGESEHVRALLHDAFPDAAPEDVEAAVAEIERQRCAAR